METIVRVSPARRGFFPVLLLLTLSFFAAVSTPFQAQTPDPPPRLWQGGTSLLTPTIFNGGYTADASTTLTANPISADARFVVYASPSPYILWPSDTNGHTDIFLRDRQTNQTTRVNVSSSGAQALGASDHPSISADGRFITFSSWSGDLVPEDWDWNGGWEVLVHDRVTQTTSLVSRATDGTPSNGDSTLSAISADGRYVAFVSMADNLAPGIVHPGQLFLRDRDVDADGVFDEPGNVSTTAISVADDGSLANGELVGTIDMTPDGRYIAFASAATNLVPNDTNGVADVFVRDRQAGHTWRASVMSDGSEAHWNPSPSLNPSLTPDGRLVVFESAASLIANEFDTVTDIMLHDSQTGETTRVNQHGGGEYGIWNSLWPSISDDGRYVAFEAGEPNRGANSYQHVFVVDRQTGYFYPGSTDVNGNQMWPMSTRPWISGDGTTIAFRHSSASGDYGDLYAAVDFSIAPTELYFDALGTEQEVTIATAPTTGWPVIAEQPWITPVDGANRAGSGTLRVKLERNTTDSSRSGLLWIGTKWVSIWQPPGVKLYAVYPPSGSTAGGDQVMIYGDGFLSGATVTFGGVPAIVTDVQWSRIDVVTPPNVGQVDVQVINGDGDTRTLAGAYTYMDYTPPVIEPIVTGALGNHGYYTGNVELTWSITDPESAVTHTNGCEPFTLTADAWPPLTFTCTATSAGGTASVSQTLMRDTQSPSITLQSPQRTIYGLGETWRTADYSCHDGDGSGVESCSGTVPHGSQFNTFTPGYHDFTVDATDWAGKSHSVTITYAVGTGVCTPPPADIVSWWTGDGHTNDLIGFNNAVAVNGSPSNLYGYGIVGRGNGSAFSFGPPSGASSINFGHDPSLTMTNAFTVAAWVFSTSEAAANQGVIVKKSGEYGLVIDNNYLAYFFGSTYPTSTYYYIPPNTWTHVAMTYDSGVLTVYLNGRAVTTDDVAATLVDVLPAHNDFMVGDSQDVQPADVPPFVGSIDEIQVYRRALTASDVESMFLSGYDGTCQPDRTELTVFPVSATFEPSGSTTLTPLAAVLMSEDNPAIGMVPAAGRTVTFTLFGETVGTAVTDSNGLATVEVNLAGKHPGTYANAIGATHLGDATIQRGTGSAALTIEKATPTLTVNAGTFVYNGSTHEATASASGIGGEVLTPVTITYNGNTTAPVNAGTYNVVASYAGSTNYGAASKTTTLSIGKAQPTVSWTPAPAVYGTPLGAAQLNASASVSGTWTYSRPAGQVLHAGSHFTEASFTPADALNYNPASTTATILIAPAPLTAKANDQVKAFGAPVPVLTIGYIGLVNGDTPATVASVLGLGTTATATSAVGTYPIGPVWGVANNNYTLAFVPGVLTVQPASTSTALTSSANPSGVNQPITFTATVGVVAPGPRQPTGTLTFSNGSTVLGTATLQNGTASLTTGLATGTHTIAVAYSGDASFAASQGSLTQTVNASSSSTTTTVTSSLNPSKSGNAVTLTARVTSSAGTPTGQVEFFNSGVLMGTGTLSSGTATLTTSTLPLGSHAITVRYLGSATRPPSLSSTLVQVVNTSSFKKKSTTLTAGASPSTGTYGNESTFTATVAPPLFQSAPTGSVRFEIDGVSATIVALTTSGRNGVATLRTSALPRGTHRIACTYLGDSNYAGSTTTITYVVN